VGSAFRLAQGAFRNCLNIQRCFAESDLSAAENIDLLQDWETDLRVTFSLAAEAGMTFDPEEEWRIAIPRDAQGFSLRRKDRTAVVF